MTSKSEYKKTKIVMRLELREKLKERFLFLKNYYEQKSRRNRVMGDFGVASWRARKMLIKECLT